MLMKIRRDSMRSMSIVILLALLTVPCIAVPDNVTTGPYKISFDLGVPKEAYKVVVSTPAKTEALSGDISTGYKIVMTNKTGISRMSTIILTSYETDQVVPTQGELVQMERGVLSQVNGLQEIQATGRKIDGVDGAIASGKLPGAYDMTLDTYVAVYYPSSTTAVGLVSTYPWDEGTLSLLKSIHVEKINATS
jgi:hypothetical protein